MFCILLQFVDSVWVIFSLTFDNCSREKVSFPLTSCAKTSRNRACRVKDHFEWSIQENLNKTGLGGSTRVPISNRIGGAEITASFSESPSDLRERVSCLSSANYKYAYFKEVFWVKIFIISRISSFDYKRTKKSLFSPTQTCCKPIPITHQNNPKYNNKLDIHL